MNNSDKQFKTLDSNPSNMTTCKTANEPHHYFSSAKIPLFIACSLLLLLSNINQIYTILTWSSKKECFTNQLKGGQGFVTPFFWLTFWVLWLSTAFFVWFVRLQIEANTKAVLPINGQHGHQSGMKSQYFHCFYQVVLCLSVATLLGYSMGLVTDPPVTNKDLCYVISDSVVQKSQPAAMLWLAMDRINNITAHYLCGFWLFALYCSGTVEYSIKFPVAPLLAVLFSVIVGLADTFLGTVYAVDNIWLSGFYIYTGVFLLHAIFYWQSQSSWRMEKRQIKAILLMVFVSGATVGLHFVPWGVWVYVGLAFMLVLHMCALLLAKPKKQGNQDDGQDCVEMGKELPFISLLASAKNEEAVIEALVRQLDNVDYPGDRYELLVVDDGSSDQTHSILSNLCSEYSQLKLHQRSDGSPGGKSGALNEALGLVNPDCSIIGVLDADAVMDPTLVSFVAQTFQQTTNQKLAAVQVRKHVSNEEANLLTRLQQYELYFDAFTQQQRVALGGMGDLRGNGMFVRRTALEDVDGWNEDTVTDDLDLAFRLQLKGHAIENFFLEPAVQEEGVTTLLQLWNQRNRWAQGSYQRMLDYGHLMFSGRLGFRKTMDVFVIFLSQHLMALAQLANFVVSVVRLQMVPLLTPIVAAMFILYLVAIFVSSLKMEGTKEPKDQRNLLSIALWSLMTMVYMSFVWPVTMLYVVCRMCLVPKQLKWVKTPRQEDGRVQDKSQNGEASSTSSTEKDNAKEIIIDV